MKKYLLTSLLGVFALFGAFANADTVDGFTSDTAVCRVSLSYWDNSSFLSPVNLMSLCSDDIPYPEDYPNIYICFGDNTPNSFYVNDYLIGENRCLPADDEVWVNDGEFHFYSDSNQSSSVDVAGYVYYSLSPITYNSSSEGGDNSGSLLPGGESDLSGIITGLNSTITEFIPYLVYLGLGIITVIIGFVAIRWLVNRTQAKIRGTFSSGRRRR